MTRRGFLEAAGIAAVVPTATAMAAQSAGSAPGSASVENPAPEHATGSCRSESEMPAGPGEELI
jgi:hypothetical protein